jgi:GNAT superfamily N-acetyltransferase
MSLIFRRYNAVEANAARAVVETVFRGGYWQALEEGDPFDTPEAFMGRFDAYASNPSLDLVIAFDDGEPVGQTWGWPLGPSSRWWEGLNPEPETGFTVEDGTRTFALSEIMVVRGHTGRGVAHALHDQLLRERREKRATLLAEPGNMNAYRAYVRWGWQPVAKLRPQWPDAPAYDVLILPLPLVPQPVTVDR